LALTSASLWRISALGALLGAAGWCLAAFRLEDSGVAELTKAIGGFLFQISVLAPLIDLVATARARARLQPIRKQAESDLLRLVSDAKSELEFWCTWVGNDEPPPPMRMRSNIELLPPFLDHADRIIARYSATLFTVDDGLRESAFKAKDLAQFVDRATIWEASIKRAATSEDRVFIAKQTRGDFNKYLNALRGADHGAEYIGELHGFEDP
jgi:hypothetical protein